MTNIFPHARGLKRTAIEEQTRYVVIYNSKSVCPWEIWFTASCGVPVFIWSVHEDQEFAAKECSKLNNQGRITPPQDQVRQAA